MKFIHTFMLANGHGFLMFWIISCTNILPPVCNEFQWTETNIHLQFASNVSSVSEI